MNPLWEPRGGEVKGLCQNHTDSEMEHRELNMAPVRSGLAPQHLRQEDPPQSVMGKDTHRPALRMTESSLDQDLCPEGERGVRQEKGQSEHWED